MRQKFRRPYAAWNALVLGTAALTISAALCGLASPADASAPQSTCETWARTAAVESGVPAHILKAIATVESGSSRSGRHAPWPWTVNVNGAGKWFDSQEDAIRYLSSVRSHGIESFDVGCFQLNYRWHGDRFASLEQMIDPSENARYAAEFLAELYREFGSWEQAIMAYHSRTPDKALLYLARVRDVLGGPDRTAPEAAPPPTRRAGTVAPVVNRPRELFDNRKPVQVSGLGRLGSLVPNASLTGGTSFFGSAQR